MTPEQLLTVVTDPRLTPEALRVILYVDTLGRAGQEHDVKGEDLAILLHGGEKPVRAAIARAVHCGYLAARHGGRAGHKLTLLERARADRNHSPAGAISSDHTSGALRNDAPQGGIPSGKPLPEGRDSAETTPPGEGFRDRGGDYRGGSRREEEVVRENPTSFHLDPRAREALDQHVDKLAGCRGALVDYLQLRVQPQNQRGFVQSIATWLDQPLAYFRQPDSTAVPTELRTARIAAALNELAAGDSEMGMRAPMGDVRNLKTKLDIVIRQAWEAEDADARSASSTGRRPRGTRSRPAPIAGTADQLGTGTDGRRSGFLIE